MVFSLYKNIYKFVNMVFSLYKNIYKFVNLLKIQIINLKVIIKIIN
ncbi:hypothetical protein [Spiroplasma citri]|nr:hypothetical protein [Spiroplasma citri]